MAMSSLAGQIADRIHFDRSTYIFPKLITANKPRQLHPIPKTTPFHLRISNLPPMGYPDDYCKSRANSPAV
jgi:hypothetical protein